MAISEETRLLIASNLTVAHSVLAGRRTFDDEASFVKLVQGSVEDIYAHYIKRVDENGHLKPPRQ